MQAEFSPVTQGTPLMMQGMSPRLVHGAMSLPGPGGALVTKGMSLRAKAKRRVRFIMVIDIVEA